ncbi:hypothetical protein K501DRAFT_201452, partial [Backusella circina FSU 941]
QLDTAAQTEENPEDISLRRLVPVIERKMANLEDLNRSAYERLAEMLNTVATNISDLSSGRAPLQISINWPDGQAIPSTTVQTITASSSPLPSPSLDSQTMNQTRSMVEPHREEVASSNTMPFRLSLTIQTVTDLYREWTVGLGSNVSVNHMNNNHPGWYKNQKSFYMRRRTIIKACESYAEKEGIVVIDAVRKAEMLRVRSHKSLDYLSKNSDKIFDQL